MPILREIILARYLIPLLLLVCAVAAADEPLPPVMDPAVIVASKDVTGTGKKSDPFVFDTSTKCLLRFTGSAEGIAWDTDDCPADFEVIDGKYGSFSLATPGLYQTAVHGGSVYSKCWFEIKGPNGPPVPDDSGSSIARRVKAAFKGQPIVVGQSSDTSRFQAVCDELAKSIDAGKVPKQSDFEKQMEAGLNAVGWPKGKYSDLTALCAELFDGPDNDWTLTAENKAAYVTSLRAISKACGEVK